MNTLIKKAADMALALVLLAVGGWIIYSSWFDAEAKDRVFDLIQNSPFLSTGVGLVLILSFLLRLSAGCRRGKKDSYINFQADDGSVGISTKAIQDFIERVGKEFAAVKSIDSKLLPTKGGLDIALDVRVLSGNKIPELSHVLQQRVRESVRESLGLEEIRNITIKVQEIIGDPARPAPAEER